MTSDSQGELYTGSTEEEPASGAPAAQTAAGPLLLRQPASVQTDGSVSAHLHYQEKSVTRGLSARRTFSLVTFDKDAR